MNIREHNLGKYFIPEEVKNGVCVDMGANVGSFIEKNLNYFSKIYYFEAQEYIFKTVLENKFNSKKNIFGYNLAGYSESGLVVDMIEHKNEDSESSAINSSYLNNGWTEKIINKVRTISLDDIYELVGERVNYFKCDIENSEYPLLYEKDLTKIDYLGIEIHHQMGEKRWKDLITHILKTHINMSNISIDYKSGYNKEFLFKIKSND